MKRRLCMPCDRLVVGRECPHCGADTDAVPPPCAECDDTGVIEVTFSSDPTNSQPMFCDVCQEGKDLNQAAAERDADEGMVPW